MSALAHDTAAKPPVLLPQVRVEVDGDGGPTVAIDRKPCDIPFEWAHLGHDAVPLIIEEVSRRLASPFRLEITDGALTFTDIVTPDGQPSGDSAPPRRTPCPGEVAGDGFCPDENVAVAIVVAHRPAGPDGVARLRLPPSLLINRPGLVVLLGLTSGAVAISDGTT